MGLFSGLLGDASLLAPSPPEVGSALDRHRRLRSDDGAGVIGPLLAEDTRRAELDRGADEPLEIIVLNSSGAGGLPALAGRTFSRLRPVGVISPLRDPGDLAGNTARVAAAARELESGVEVYVAFPSVDVDLGQSRLTGWDDAVAAAEAEGLSGSVDLRLQPSVLAAQLSAFIEADLPFRAGILRPDASPGLLELLVAIDSLIDDASPARAAAILGLDDHDWFETVAGWDEARISRVRRRLLGVDCADLPAVVDRLPTTDPAT